MTGVYFVTARDMNGCYSEPSAIGITVGCSPAIVSSLPAAFHFSVAPNPAYTEIKIAYSNSGVFEILNIAGKVIMTVKLPESSDIKTIYLSGFAPGLYIYRYYSGSDIITSGKLVIVK